MRFDKFANAVICALRCASRYSHSVIAAVRWSRFGFTLIAILALAAAVKPSACAAPPDDTNTTSSTIQHQKMDVVVIVWPDGPSSARVAVAYNGTVSRSVLNKELASLGSAFGGVVTNVSISNGSVHPENLKQFPVSTSVMFSLTGCSQLTQSAPNLRPYISAFQSHNTVEVVFAIPTLGNYVGPVKFDLPELSLMLFKEPDAYRYDVAIREHKKDLPQFPQNQVVQEVSNSGSNTEAPSQSAVNHGTRPPSSNAPLIASMAGFVLTVLVLCIYLVKTSKSSSASRQSRHSHRTNL